MDANEFGLCVKLDGVGYVDKRYKKSLHDVKSVAGKAFHSDLVRSVCVYDASGTARLYLKKTPNGVVREEVK